MNRRRLRRWGALLILASTAQVIGIVVLVVHASTSDHAATADTLSLNGFLHGHHHAKDTPEHGHAFTRRVPQIPPGKDPGIFGRSVSIRQLVELPQLEAILQRFEVRPLAVPGAGPPPGIAPLRV